MTTLHTDTTLELASMIGGEPADAGASLYDSTNPAELEEVVARVRLGDATTVLGACRSAREAQSRWSAVPPPVRGNVIAKVAGAGPPQQGRPGRDRHARGRQADRRGAWRGPGGDRHLRVLPQRGPSPVRDDRPVGDARQAAVHLPHARRRRGDRHRRQLPGRRARRGTSRRRCCVATRSCGSPPSTRRRARGRSPSCSGGPACRPTSSISCSRTGRALSTGSSRRSTRVSSRRSDSPARPTSAGASASCAGGTCSRRAWSSVARTRWS